MQFRPSEPASVKIDISRIPAFMKVKLYAVEFDWDQLHAEFFKCPMVKFNGISRSISKDDWEDFRLFGDTPENLYILVATEIEQDSDGFIALTEIYDIERSKKLYFLKYISRPTSVNVMEHMTDIYTKIIQMWQDPKKGSIQMRLKWHDLVVSRMH